jgi:hypothetical protein
MIQVSIYTHMIDIIPVRRRARTSRHTQSGKSCATRRYQRVGVSAPSR